MTEHSKEFVILEITPQYGRPFTDESKRKYFQLVKESLGDTLAVVQGSEER